MLKHTIIAASAFALLLSGPAFAQNAADASTAPDESADESAAPDGNADEISEFVGRYNGNSFETAMGMIVRADGTFQWGLSVGGLDLRAKGTWKDAGGRIVFASNPKPVAPEFVWSSIEDNSDGPFLRVVRASNGKPFGYGSVRGICANNAVVFGSVMQEGWSPDEECDKVETVQLALNNYQVLSLPFELTGERAVSPGQTIVLEFHDNDLGVADFDGTTGRLEDGTLHIESGLGAMTLRKMPEPSTEPEPASEPAF